MTNVVYLHGHSHTLAQFVRIGAGNHRLLEHLLAAGSLPVRRFVVDAALVAKQTDLLSALRADGRELVLDTNVAELSVIGRFQGMAREAPWAVEKTVLTPAHFKRGANEFDVVGRIARFAVEKKFHRVQAPAHLLTGIKYQWCAVDLDACSALRRSLDI